MRYCPTCKASYPTGTDICDEDRTELVNELPFQTIDADGGGTWVEIATTSTDDEARLLQGFLEAQGIACQIESLKFTMEPVNLGSMGEIRVYVAAESEAEAVQMLSDRQKEFEAMPQEESLLSDEGLSSADYDLETEPERGRS
ncbi:MAG TPA: hypothetical protein VNM92_16970 [Thermoanaerobaculia bacterium]|nr:hypothetical protein [Thermoanaerobaculia bacterium]